MNAAELLAAASTQRTGVAGLSSWQASLVTRCWSSCSTSSFPSLTTRRKMGSTTAMASRLLASYILALRDVRSRLN